MRPRSSANAVFFAALVALAPGAARAQAMSPGFDLERAGRLDSAAAFYLSSVRGDPTNLPALLGLERVLPQLGRMWELLPLAQRAVARDSASGALRGLLVRTYAAVDLPDSAAAAAGRWARARPGDEAPYRELALALVDRRSYERARQVLVAGRKALGEPTAFGIELAELAAQTGDWEDAAREWGALVTTAPTQAQIAVAQLAEAPAEQRERIIRQLTARDAPPPVARLAADLVLRWGDPARAWSIFESTLDAPTAETARALRHFADLAAAPGTPTAWRVRGLALSRFATLVSEPVAVRARVEAARAFLQAGDAMAARAELERVAADDDAPPDAQRLAAATLIGALIHDGQLDSAASRLAATGEGLDLESRAALGAALARARIRRGQLTLADSALASDSGVEALALRGWIALYRGDLRNARAEFRAAGPYAGDRRDATERTAMLALIERITGDGNPALGRALLTLARGDSTAAVGALREAAAGLAPAGGRADVLLLAGRVAAQLDGARQEIAIELFDAVVRTGEGGAAPPAAELEWARLLERRGMTADAVQHLEHLILTYPGSAVVPEARRDLERAKGAIPRS
jgi:tetratricopeptide (TPR) repeat protein